MDDSDVGDLGGLILYQSVRRHPVWLENLGIEAPNEHNACAANFRLNAHELYR